jgi:hypothetical protein
LTATPVSLVRYRGFLSRKKSDIKCFLEIFSYICSAKFIFLKDGWIPPEESGFLMSIPELIIYTVMPCASVVMAGAAFEIRLSSR